MVFGASRFFVIGVVISECSETLISQRQSQTRLYREDGEDGEAHEDHEELKRIFLRGLRSFAILRDGVVTSERSGSGAVRLPAHVITRRRRDPDFTTPLADTGFIAKMAKLTKNTKN